MIPELLKVGTIESGGHFGNRALESDPESGEPRVRNATVTVESESCDLFVLSREKFLELRGQGGIIDDDVMKKMEEVELARAKQNDEMLSERKGEQEEQGDGGIAAASWLQGESAAGSGR